MGEPMIANLLFVSAASLLVLTILDVFLSDAQKKAISDWTTNAWYFLDGERTRFMKRPLVGFIVLLTIIAICCTAVVLFVIRIVSEFQIFYTMFGWLFGWSTSGQVKEMLWYGVYLSGVFLLTMLAVLSPILLLYLALGALFAFELIMRRLAEHPKGPIIGIGLVVTAIAGLLKSLS